MRCCHNHRMQLLWKHAFTLPSLPSISLEEPRVAFSAYTRSKRRQQGKPNGKSAPSPFLTHKQRKAAANASSSSSSSSSHTRQQTAHEEKVLPLHLRYLPANVRTDKQKQEYFERQSYWGRINVLRSRLHNAFQMLEEEKYSLPLTTESDTDTHTTTTTTSTLSAAQQQLLEQTETALLALAPFTSPFPDQLYYQFVRLLSMHDPIRAEQWLKQAHDVYHLPFTMQATYPTYLVVINALSKQPNQYTLIKRLIDRLHRIHHIQPDIQLLTALLHSCADTDVKQVEQTVQLMRKHKVMLSERCYEKLLAVYTQPVEGGDESMVQQRVQQCLQQLTQANMTITPVMAYHLANMIKRWTIQQQQQQQQPQPHDSKHMDRPSVYLPTMFQYSWLPALPIIDGLMRYHQIQPELVHNIMLALTPSTANTTTPAATATTSIPSPTTETYTLLLQSYAMRDHRILHHINLCDVLMIERILADMQSLHLAENTEITIIRMMIHAQRGEGNSVLELMKQLIEPSATTSTATTSTTTKDKNQQLHDPSISAAMFLPVLQSIASLSADQRLPVFVSLHTYLHQHRLTSIHSFHLLFRLHADLADVNGIKATMRLMQASHIPMNIHHWNQLLRCHSRVAHPSSTAVAHSEVIHKLMHSLHVPINEYTHALMIQMYSNHHRTAQAERYYAQLMQHHTPAPLRLIRLAMVDMYVSHGYVRFAAVRYWKTISGEREQHAVMMMPPALRHRMTIHEYLTITEMQRMLQQMQVTKDIVEQEHTAIHTLVAMLQKEQDKYQQMNYTQYIAKCQEMLPVHLRIHLTDAQQQAEKERLDQQKQYLYTEITSMELRAQYESFRGALDKVVYDHHNTATTAVLAYIQYATALLNVEPVSLRALKQFASLMKFIKTNHIYVHMEVLRSQQEKEEQQRQDKNQQQREQQQHQQHQQMPLDQPLHKRKINVNEEERGVDTQAGQQESLLGLESPRFPVYSDGDSDSVLLSLEEELVSEQQRREQATAAAALAARQTAEGSVSLSTLPVPSPVVHQDTHLAQLLEGRRRLLQQQQQERAEQQQQAQQQ